MPGLIHIYCGDGKGKTTAAVGLSVRAAGAGKRVLFAQFFKDGSSSEIKILEQLPQVQTDICKTHYGFYKRMDEVERGQARRDYTALLEDVLEKARDAADLLVLDEVISACNHGMVPENRLLEFLEGKPKNLEVVLTGRGPSQALVAMADYVTEMKKEKHPFDRGIPARKGIEF